MKRTLALAGSGMLAASLLVATTTSADAAPRPAADRAPVVSHDTGVDTRADRAAVRGFWTKARMKAAVPRGQERPAAKPGGSGPKPSTTGTNLGTAWTAGRVTVGKVFFQMGGSLYVCSGNAVDDVEDGVTTANLVVTAGHCVNDGGSAFATNFMFIPRYNPAAPRTSGQPDGTFTATRLTTTSQWAAQGADMYNYDVGMARVGVNEHGETLAAAVGDTSDIAFVGGDPGATTADYTVNTHSFGYPAARPYDGTTLISCWGATTADNVGGSTDYRLPCNMTGGSSGGPWLLDATAVDPADPIDNTDVSDVQISVNSFGYRGEKNAMYGPIFGSTVQALYANTASGS